MADTQDILAGLDPEQTAIAQAVEGPMVVIAGAGTGKTRALTHRIAYGVATGAMVAQQTLALTFTTKAAGEMRSRLASLRVPGVQARTFHSAALRQAKYFWPQATHTEFPAVTERSMPMVAEAASHVGVSGDTARLRDLTAEVSWAKSCNVSPQAYESAAEAAGRLVSGVSATQVADVLAAYERVKHRAGVIDLDDILLATLGLVTQYPAVAEQVHDTYRNLFVDEYQDVSPLQHALLKAWLGDSDQIVAVGDPAQAIHAFAGADPKFLLGFARDFPRAQTFKLVRNYRSSATVVNYANSLAARSHGMVPAVKLLPQRPGGAPVTQLACDSGEHEVTTTITWLREHNKAGLPWHDMAVLYRVNSQSVRFEAALAEASIPYAVRGAERFYERPEVRAALTAWRSVASSAPDGAVSSLRDALMRLGWTPDPPDGQGRQRERWESWQALAQLVDGFPPEWTTIQAVLEIERLADEQQAPTSDGVVLATLHSAKGLEFEAVAIVGVQEGLVPYTLATSPSQLAEENRLLYVGATRARQWLRISWDGSRRRPSRFLDAPAARSGGRSESRPKRQLRKCRVCGEVLLVGADIKLGRHATCPSNYDEALLDDLKAWRLQRSRTDDVPAFVVFSDATLMAVTEAVPTTRAALLEVSGIGPSKLERYGDELLGILRRQSGGA
ncbi:MAG: ATP-dependent DNA helicase UvrD2 [Propionibacteriaceae bacterium]|nr:ATP-dependent DNA helicase UvrD2 [Propionibacteriaceae bacterium]